MLLVGSSSRSLGPQAWGTDPNRPSPHNRWVALARRAVVATSFPPLSQLYRGVYMLAAHLVTLAVRSSPSVRAVYLGGGCGRGQVVPGVSDIDLTLFVDLRPGADTGYARRYRSLLRLLPLLDAWPTVFDAENPQAEYERHARCEYEWFVGRRDWRLLYGEDLLSGVEMRTSTDMQLGLVCWAGIYSGLLIKILALYGSTTPDRILIVSACWRCSASALQIELSLSREEPLPTRQAALAAAQVELPEEAAFVTELRQLAANRFLREPPGLAERACAFLFRRSNSTMGKLRSGPFWASAPGMAADVCHEPDGTLAELYVTPEEHERIAWVVRLASEQWGSTYRAAYLAPTVFHTLGDLVLALEVDPERTPTPEQIRRVWNALADGTRMGERRILCYLLLPEGAIHLGVESLVARAERWLHPAAHPDFFALLQRDEFRLDGAGAPPVPAPVVTTAMQRLLRESVERLKRSGISPGRPLTERVDVAAAFWKRLQVAFVESTLTDSEVAYPVTVAAIERRLAKIGAPLPPELAPLREAVLNLDALPDAEAVRAEAELFLQRAISTIQSSPMDCATVDASADYFPVVAVE